MNKFFLVIFVLNFMAVKVCASGQVVSAVGAIQQNQNDFTRMKHALLMKNILLVYQIQEENPDILSYVDPQTGRMLSHEIFMHAYPEESIEFVMQNIDEPQMNAKDVLGNRPLHYFIQNATVYSDQELREIFKWLKRKYARPLSKNKNGVTPLHLAAGQDKFQILNEVVSMLPCGFEEKGYLDVKDNSGKTPLMYAFDKCRTKNVLMLLDKKALLDEEFIEYMRNYFDKQSQKEIESQNISDPEKQDELKKEYIKNGNQNIARLLVQAKKRDQDLDIYSILQNVFKSGVDVNVKDPVLGNTLLHWAMNAYIDQPDGSLQVVPRGAQDEIVKNLLAFGADPKLKNRGKCLPDYFGKYQSSLDYYKNLQNSVEMNEKQTTLFGQSVMEAYEFWFSGYDTKLLKEFLCSRDNQILEIPQERARSFFKPEFVEQICS